MKIQNIILSSAIATSLLFASCTNSPEARFFETEQYTSNSDNHYVNEEANSNETSNPTNNYTAMNTNQRPVQTQKNTSQKIVMKPLKNIQTGEAYGYYPLPESWTIKNDGWYGPNGTKVVFYTMPFQPIQQEQYKRPEQVLRGRIGQEIMKSGVKIIQKQNLASVAACDKRTSESYWSPGFMKSTEAMGMEISAKGEQGYMIIKTELQQSQFYSQWNYSFIALEASPSNYEHAKKTLIYALSNYKPNMQFINRINSIEQQKSNQSWARHNNKMRNSQRNFQATNQAIQSAYSDINDMSMNTYRSQSNSFNRMNQSTMNGIYNENTVMNPYSGNSHQVDANYDRTFMNSFGDQIQTNDQFYNPENDPYANGYQEVYPNGGGGY